MTVPYQWKGIVRQQTFEGPGGYYVQNCRFWQEGELQRRHGLSFVTATSGTGITDFRHPTLGRFAIFAGSGNLVAVQI